MALTYQEDQILKTTAAKQEILELSARFGRAFEQADVEEWTGCFVVEGILEEPGRDPVAGHPALARRFGELRRDLLHLTTDSEITVEGLKGQQQSRFLVLERDADGRIVIRESGTYRDELVFERGRWYIFRRVVVPAFA